MGKITQEMAREAEMDQVTGVSAMDPHEALEQVMQYMKDADKLLRSTKDVKYILCVDEEMKEEFEAMWWDFEATVLAAMGANE